ncbi:MAG: ribose-5-phosphate isomerase A, partial [Anaerolineales bacterium]|nr:ribose-5-phosphate isomerase A [Anaerolineales bacterium]
EVVGFAERPLTLFLESLGARVVRRPNKAGTAPFITDEHNLILDCHVARLDDPAAFAQTVIGRPGVVEHGLFLGYATQAIVAMPDEVVVLSR